MNYSLKYFNFEIIKDEVKKEGYIMLDKIENHEDFVEITITKYNFVYLAKIYNKRLMFNNFMIKNNFYNEIKIAKLFKNNNKLLSFFEYFYTKNYCFILYDFTDMQLFKIILKKEYKKHKKISLNYILIFIKDILLSIEQLHKKKIIHCNLNLENLYFKENKVIIGGYDFCRFKNESKLNSFNYLFFSKNKEIKFNLWSPEVILNKFLNFKTQIYNMLLLIYSILIKKDLIKIRKFNDLKNFYWSNDTFVLNNLDLYLKSFINKKNQRFINNLFLLFQKSLIKKLENRISFFDFKNQFNIILDKLHFSNIEFVLRKKLFIENFKNLSLDFDLSVKNKTKKFKIKNLDSKKFLLKPSDNKKKIKDRFNRSENFKKIVIKSGVNFFKKSYLFK